MKIKREIDGKEYEFELTWREYEDFRSEWFREQVLYAIDDLQNEDVDDDCHFPDKAYDELRDEVKSIAEGFEESYLNRYFDSGVFDCEVKDYLLNELSSMGYDPDYDD